MPICFKPGRKITHVLKGDRADPSPARFTLSALSGEQAMDLADQLSALSDVAKKKGLTGRQALKYVYDAVRPHVLGWDALRDADGKDVPFDPAKLESILSVGEARELAQAIVAGVSEDDLGK
jgi:hypothetical protein